MSQELTVALRIKAFLDEARRSVRDFKSDLDDVGNAADRTGAKLRKVGGSGATPAATPTPLPAPVAAPANAGLQQQQKDLQALIASLDPATAAAERMAKAEATLAAALARGAIDQATYSRYLAVLQKQHQAGAISAGQHAQAMRQLPAQITDIATSLASGMPAYMVFIQQGGQIRDSFGGAGGALKALTGLLTPLRLAMGAAVAAVGAAVLAYKQAADEEDAFNRSIVMSGNAAGTTTGQLEGMADAAARVSGTHSQAAQVLTQLVATGEVANEKLKEFTQTAIGLERAGGQAASTTVKQFEELGKNPLQATLKFNDSLHYMTAALYDQIQALLKRGDTEQAADVAQAALARALDQRTAALESRLGNLDRAWRSVGESAKKAWDWFSGLFRGDTVEQEIEKQTKAVEYLQKVLADREGRGLATGDLRDKLAAARNHLQDLQQDKDEQASLARTQADAAKVADEYARARQENQRWHDAALPKQQLLNERLEQYRANLAKIRAGGGVVSPEQQAREERAIRDEVYGKGFDLEQAKAQAALQRATIQANLQLLQASIKDGDAIIQQALKDGQISIEAAYAARLSQVTTEGEAQRRAYEAEAEEIDKALRKAKTQAERDPLLQQKVELQAKVKLLDASLTESARQLQLWKTEQERTLSAITAKVRVDVSTLTGKFDREAFRAQLQESMRADYEAVGRLADPAEQQAARARLDMIAAASMAQGEFNAKLAEAQRLQGQLSVTEADLQVQQQQGLISQVELEARLKAARAAQVPALQEIVQQLQAIRDAVPPEAAAAIDAMTKSIGDLKVQVRAATPVVVDLGTRLKNTAIDGLADAAATAVTNFSNLRSAISTTLKQIAGDIVRSGIKRLLEQQFSVGGTGSSGGSGSGLLSAIISVGRTIFGFADGGLIRGPGTGTSDSIPALVNGRRPIAVSNHEFIQPERAVKHYGVGFMEAVRTLKLPKPGYAFGGLVAAHQRARFATGGLVTAGAPQAPTVVFQMVNKGTPQRVVDQRQQFDGKQMVVSVVLDDINRGGPISQAMGVRR